MGAIFGFITSIFTQHKLKVFMFSLFSLVFTLLMFPFGDLSDKITTEIAKATGNTVYVQFDDLSLTMIPQPALKMVNVVAEIQQAPELTLTELDVAPSLLSLIKQKVMGRISGQGFFAGDLDLNISGSSKIKDSQAMSTNLEYTDFNLKEIFKALQKVQALPVAPTGIGQIKANMDFDPNMKTQPDGDLSFQIKDMDLPAFSIPLASFGGALPVPGVNLEKFSLKGSMKNGKFTIAETLLGSPKDELSGKISGDMDIKIAPNMSNFDFGAYNLSIDITIREGLQNQLGATYMSILDGMLGKFKRSSAAGNRYVFRVQAANFQQQAQFLPL